MKKTVALLLALCLMSLSACSQGSTQPTPSATPIPTAVPTATPAVSTTVTLTDATDKTLVLDGEPTCVVGLSSSLAEIWLLAGGTLSGVTNDAVEERGMDVGDAEIVGTIKKPVVETILALEPDLVIFSADIESHLEARVLLEQSNIPCYAAKVERFEDYLKVLADFTALTGREDLYAKNGTDVEAQIQALRDRVPAEGQTPTALYLRAFSSGVKVKARDNVACDILADVGVINVAEGNPKLEELSMEAIVEADPDFIFTVTMGDEAKAVAEMERALYSNPAWSGLTAVQNGHNYMLPKDLFHYKPNARWGEAYEYLLNLLWPEVYPQT